MTEATDRIEEARPLRFRRYSAYKDAGVEWLGEIPAHWESKALKRSFGVVNGSTPQSGEPGNWDGHIPWVTPDDLGKMMERVLNEPARYITRRGYESCGTRMVRGGSLILSIRAPIGHLAIAGTAVCTNQGCRSLVFRHPGNETYFYFQLHAARPVLEAAGRGSTFKELASADLESVALSVPPLDEQSAIATFLDRETAQIDGLVERKERLIELLQEKRTALITRAVTRGLDQNAPMKDSGVKWLGEIPAHWEVKQLNHLLKARKGAIKTGPFGSQLKSSSMQAGEIKVYNQRSVLDRDFSSGDNYVSLEKFAELSAFEVYPGDLLITTRGSIGRCSILPKEAERGVLHPCLMRVQPDERWILTRFLEIQIEGCSIVLDQLRFMSNATTIDVIYSDSLRQVWLSVPPVEEQTATIAFVAREKARIDALIAKVRQAIDHLKEFRSALISAAVTGKIDVREDAS